MSFVCKVTLKCSYSGNLFIFLFCLAFKSLYRVIFFGFCLLLDLMHKFRSYEHAAISVPGYPGTSLYSDRCNLCYMTSIIRRIQQLVLYTDYASLNCWQLTVRNRLRVLFPHLSSSFLFFPLPLSKADGSPSVYHRK